MIRRLPLRLAAAAGFCLGSPALAGEPAKLNLSATPAAVAAADQRLADTVAARLAKASQISGFEVDIACQGGVVDLSGTVRDSRQQAEIVAAVRTVAGVKKVQDRTRVGESAIKPAQANEFGLPPGAVPLPPAAPPSSMPGVIGDSPLPSGPSMMPPPGAMHGHGGPMPGSGGVMPIDPQPIGGGGASYDLNPPKMPPYAWPTYAPHNNYSRVGYPTEYPHNAFPFIGPFYPFPKVPLGFRAIKLEWEDGHWWYGKTATRRDYWSIRYW